jgi:hypothetical protein
VQWRTKFAILAPRVSAQFGGQAAYERWVERFLAMFEDASVFTYSGASPRGRNGCRLMRAPAICSQLSASRLPVLTSISRL